MPQGASSCLLQVLCSLFLFRSPVSHCVEWVWDHAGLRAEAEQPFHDGVFPKEPMSECTYCRNCFKAFQVHSLAHLRLICRAALVTENSWTSQTGFSQFKLKEKRDSYNHWGISPQSKVTVPMISVLQRLLCSLQARQISMGDLLRETFRSQFTIVTLSQ